MSFEDDADVFAESDMADLWNHRDLSVISVVWCSSLCHRRPLRRIANRFMSSVNEAHRRHCASHDLIHQPLRFQRTCAVDSLYFSRSSHSSISLASDGKIHQARQFTRSTYRPQPGWRYKDHTEAEGVHSKTTLTPSSSLHGQMLHSSYAASLLAYSTLPSSMCGAVS